MKTLIRKLRKPARLLLLVLFTVNAMVLGVLGLSCFLIALPFRVIQVCCEGALTGMRNRLAMWIDEDESRG